MNSMHDNTERKAFDLAVRYLGNREHSQKEIIEKLSRKEFSEEIINKTLKRLDELGLIDDRSFAVNYVGSRLRRKSCGHFKLKHELLQKGVEEEVVNAVLADFDNSSLCLEAALKKLPFIKGDKQQKHRKLYAFLTNRGFDSHTIRETLEEVFRKEGGV